jgi:hypothetical protein
VVQAPKPNHIEPLFTRDPAQISEIQVLMAMMAIKGIYAEYGVQPPQPRHRLRHRPSSCCCPPTPNRWA